MRADGLLTGPAGLLRVAGLPAGLLARAGNPPLFDRIRAQQRSATDYAEFAGHLAAQLTTQLVPHPDLPAPVRGLAVAIRRVLLRGRPVDPERCRRLAVVNAVLDGQDSLTAALLRAADWAQGLGAEEARLTRMIDHECGRVVAVPWELVRGCAAAHRVVADAAPLLPAEIEQRLADDPGWSGKRMRQRADYLLRILARAAFKTTPRGWLGQVAVVQAGPGSADRLVAGTRVGDFAVHAVANIGVDRRALAAAGDLPDAWLSMTGLHWVDDDRLFCWVAAPDTEVGARLVRVRRTRPVDVIRQALGDGVVRAADVVSLLTPAGQGGDVARGFLHHLVRLGVVQASARPAADLRRWHTRPRQARPVTDGFTDVYRRAEGHVPAAALDRLADLVDQARRVHDLAAPRPVPHPALAVVDTHPRPVTELLCRFLDDHPPRPPRRPDRSWGPADPGTPRHGLLTWLADHGDRGDREEAVLTPAVLDTLGAPPAEHPPWPVDCLVRPLPAGGAFAVLEAVLAAGVTDGRFADALRGLHDDVSQVDDYRTFLTAAAARCDAEAVEVLVPPNGTRGANIVRRPRYTGVWTGDADAATYFGTHPGTGRYLPLRHITLRRDGERLVAQDRSGRRLWPVCHANRVPPPPWDVVLALLTAATPVSRLAAPFLPGDPTTAFPAGQRLPRLVLDGGLVLAPRSVILARDDLPRAGAPAGERVRALAALRTRTGAPRWNFLRAHGAGRPRPVDLDSVAALRVFDRVLADPGVTAVVLEEMLPGPDELTVRDEAGDPLAAQLLLRLPHRTGPDRLAEDVARAHLADSRAAEEPLAALTP